MLLGWLARLLCTEAGGTAAQGGRRGCCAEKRAGLLHGEAGKDAARGGVGGGLLRSERCVTMFAERQAVRCMRIITEIGANGRKNINMDHDVLACAVCDVQSLSPRSVIVLRRLLLKDHRCL